MSKIHICTPDTFFDAPDLDWQSTCPVCLTTCMHQVGWIGVRCTNCRVVLSDEDWMGSIVRRRRELLKLTRRQMGEITGYSPKTIKTYEFTRCSKAYSEKTADAVRLRPKPEREAQTSTAQTSN